MQLTSSNPARDRFCLPRAPLVKVFKSANHLRINHLPFPLVRSDSDFGTLVLRVMNTL